MAHSNQQPETTVGSLLVRQPAPAVGRNACAEVPAPCYPYESADYSDSSSLLDYWRILRRYKKSLVAFAISGTILGIAVGVPQKPVYQVSTSVEVLNLNED